MSQYPQQSRPWSLEYGQATDRTMFNFFNAVYAWMAVGLALTAAVGYAVSQSQAMLRAIYGGPFIMVAAAIGMLVITMATQRVALRVGAAAGTAMFLVYAALMGLLIS